MADQNHRAVNRLQELQAWQALYGKVAVFRMHEGYWIALSVDVLPAVGTDVICDHR